MPVAAFVYSKPIGTCGLNDELTKPMNVHRWRVLESSDPKRYEMIATVQDLQKALVLKGENILKHESMIQEKEKIYLELKNIISPKCSALIVFCCTLIDRNF